MTCPQNNPHLLWPISLWMRECLASLALCFVTGHAHYNKYTPYIQLLHYEHCICTKKLMLDVTTCGAVEPDSDALISFNAVEQLYSRFWLKRLSLPSKSEGHTRQTCGKHCLSSVLVLLTLTGRQNVCNVVLQFYSTTHFHISWSFLQRAAYVSEYKPIWISLTFRQVPVGIYNTLITRSSLSAALTLNASATNWADTFFLIISQIVEYSKQDNSSFKIAQRPEALLYNIDW